MGAIFYGLKMTLRKPSMWIGTFLGIVLAVGLLFSVFMTTDYASVATVRQYTNLVKVDMNAYMYFSSEQSFHAIVDNYSEHVKNLESIEYVDRVEFLLRTIITPNVTFGNRSSWEVSREGISLFLIQKTPRFSGVSISGNLNDGIGIGKQLASYLGISIGDNITITMFGRKLNLTISAIVDFGGEYYEKYFWVSTGSFWNEIYQRYGYVAEEPQLYPVIDPNFGLVIFIDNWEYIADLIQKATNDTNAGMEFMYSCTAQAMIILDKESIVDPFDLPATKARINKAYNEIRMYLQKYFSQEYELHITNYLGLSVYVVETQLTSVRIGFLFMMLPVLFLSVILALVANWILVNKRRREIGLLKIRGMSSRQIFMNFVIEIVLIGIVAGIVGLGVAYGVSYLVSQTLARTFAESVDPVMLLNSIVGDYVVPSIIMGMILGFISIYYPARRVATLDILTSISEYVPEIEKEVKVGKVLWVFIIISAYGLIEILLGMPTYKILMTEIMKGRYYLAFLLMIYFPIYFIAIIGGPIILAYGCAKIVAAYSDRFSKVLEIFSRPFSGDLSKIAVEQFIRKKARVYKVILLIVMTLVFGIFFTINNATSRNRIRINLEISIGADIKVGIHDFVPYSNVTSINNTVYEVEGAGEASYIGLIYLPYDPSTNISMLYIVDPAYIDVSYMRDGYTEEVSLSEMKEILRDPTKVLLPICYKDVEGYEVGSTIYLPFAVNNTLLIYNFTVAGYIKWAPGIAGMFELYFNKYIAFIGPAIFDRIGHSVAQQTRIGTILIDVKDKEDPISVGYEIKSVFDDLELSTSIQVFQKSLDDVYNNWVIVYQQVFVDVLFYLSIAMAIIGMTLTMVTSIIERRREIALLRVRGGSLSNLLGMVLGEVAVITILGYILGIGLALVYTYGYLVVMSSMSFLFMGITPEFPPGYLLTIPPKLYVIVGSAFVAFLFSAVIPLLVLYREDPSQEIRITH